MFLKIFLEILTHFAALILQLFSVCEWEEIEFVFFIVLPLFVLFLFFGLQELIVVPNKLISLAHEKFILPLSISSHLFFNFLYNVLLGLSCEHEISLCLCKLFLHLFDILITKFLERGHVMEINAPAESCVHSTLKHAWKARDSYACLLVNLTHLLVSETIIHVLTWLRIRIRHLDKLDLSSLCDLGTRLS